MANPTIGSSLAPHPFAEARPFPSCKQLPSILSLSGPLPVFSKRPSVKAQEFVSHSKSVLRVVGCSLGSPNPQIFHSTPPPFQQREDVFFHSSQEFSFSSESRFVRASTPGEGIGQGSGFLAGLPSFPSPVPQASQCSSVCNFMPGMFRDIGTQVSPSQVSSPPLTSPGVRNLPPHFRLEDSRMEAVSTGLRLRGWSSTSLRCSDAELKDTTQASYQRIWSWFLAYLDERNIPHRDVNDSHVFNFLSHQGLDKNKAWKTVGVYKNALFLPLLYRLRLNIGRKNACPETNTLMTGLHRLKPPAPPKMPLWELSDLLSYLNSSVFEPLDTVSFSRCLQKFLALLLLATGRRISEISGLSRIHSKNASKTVLHWLPSFTPKHFTRFFHPDHPSFYSLDPAIEDRSLCPFRAWRIYVEKRQAFTHEPLAHRLWILSRGDLTLTFKDLVKESRQFVGKHTQVPMGPHNMRKFACSYSKCHWPRSSSKLFTAIGSKSMRILTRCYIKRVPPLRFSCVLPLGTAKVTNRNRH